MAVRGITMANGSATERASSGVMRQWAPRRVATMANGA